jgi:hypothetical protein
MEVLLHFLHRLDLGPRFLKNKKLDVEEVYLYMLDESLLFLLISI